MVDGALGPGHRLIPVGSGARLAGRLLRRPGAVASRTRELTAELAEVAVGRSTRTSAKRDRRFTDPAWSSNPVLRRIVQAYLAAGGSARALLADAGLDWRDRTRLELAVDNVIAGLAPSNNPLVNPSAWKAVIDSGGGSIVTGLRNLVTDLVSAPRIPAMVRPDAYEVGVDLAVTPGAVVLRTETFELIRYAPQTATVATRPVLVVPPVINKYYLVDLAPGRSLAEFLVQGGQQVLVVSWRNPDARHREWDLDTYGRAIEDALDAALAVTGADAATLLGFCSGGTLQSITLAALAHRGQLGKVAGFAVAVCVLDQTRAGVGAALVDDTTAKAAVAASRARGYLDGRTLAEVFAWLKPDDLVWSYWVNNYLLGRDPARFDILFWNADTTRMAAGLHRDFIELALTNALVSPGTATMSGRPVDLSDIDVDGYVVAGATDHICPWQSCYRSAGLFGGTTRFVLSTGGHIAATVNPPGNPRSSFQAGEDVGDPAVTVVRFDPPGAGGSPLPGRPYRMRGLALAMTGLLDTLGHERVDVLGISWGGAVAQQFAHTAGDRCRRLVLVATGTGSLMVPAGPGVLATMATPRRHLDPGFLRRVAPGIYGGVARDDPERVVAIMRRHSRGGSWRGYACQLLAGAGWTSLAFLPRLRQPTLVLAGDDDPIIPLANAHIMTTLIPGARLHVYRGGHIDLVAAPERLAPVVEEFLGHRTPTPDSPRPREDLT
ncbi:alpha/beta fold hydrolase [Pseudonocardia sediminis]|nr:alpha/beta fold hydrolase [Pseudonocardia sediminis]